MSDDIWRNDDVSDPGPSGRRPGRFESSMDDFDSDEFGGPLFGDDSGGVTSPRHDDRVDDQVDEPVRGGDGDVDGAISFGDDSTGPLPHWTEPPTGEVPKIETSRSAEASDDDLDVWSTFTSESPVWKEGDSVDAPTGTLSSTGPGSSSPSSSEPAVELEGSPRFADESVVAAADEPGRSDGPLDPTGELRWEDDQSFDAAELPTGDGFAPTAATDVVDGAATQREPGRITIGTDPSGMPRRPDPVRRGGSPQRPPSSSNPVAGGDKRNLPIAIATGVGLAVVFLGLTILVGPLGALLFATVVLAVAGIEYFGKVTEKGYRPAVAPGVTAIAAAPLAGYWVGTEGIVLVLVFGFIAGALGFIGASSIESGPMPNMAITMLGIVWIGVLGAYAGMLLDYSNLSWTFSEEGTPWGTDTLVLLAIGVVANDVGAYFVGSAFGRTPLRSWISPAKSLEGFLGGMVLTLLVMVIIGRFDLSYTWSSMSHLLMFGIVVSLLAPLGDLTESMFKRNLDVKDFGTLIKGHGGVLDRFDGFLFTLPGVYYLFLVLTPWTEYTPAVTG